MRREPAPAVTAWFDQSVGRMLYFSAVGEAEIRRGAALLPIGRRRDQLIAAVNAMVREDFAGRILPFDSRAAVAFADIFANRRAVGRPISFPDCQIAAVALANQAAIATRNVSDFEGCGITVINPWVSRNKDG